jgi:hypothetical protein
MYSDLGYCYATWFQLLGLFIIVDMLFRIEFSLFFDGLILQSGSCIPAKSEVANTYVNCLFNKFGASFQQFAL